MKNIQTPDDIRKLGTIMTVAAHPDDESFLAAGILATAVKNGQKVICVTATRGEAGSQDEARWPQAKLAQIRTQELNAALKILGISEHQWLDYADGYCGDVKNHEACRCVLPFLKKYQPDTILTFGPEGLTGHPDHASVSRWVDLAVKEMVGSKPQVYHAVVSDDQYHNYLSAADQKMNIFFNIDQPPIVAPADCAIYFELPAEMIKSKHRALAAMPSQTEKLLASFDDEFFAKAFGTECFVVA